MNSKARFATFLVALYGTLVGCTATDGVRNLAPSDTQTGVAVLEVYRVANAFGSAAPFGSPVHVNGESAGRLHAGTNFTINVPAGECTIEIKGSRLLVPFATVAELSFRAEAGKTYYLRYSWARRETIIYPGGASAIGSHSLSLVNEDQWKSRK